MIPVRFLRTDAHGTGESLWGGRPLAARMALLPDPATAGLYAVVVFLITLGVLVLFIETIAFLRFVAVVVASFVLALGLILIGELGLSLPVLGFGSAFIANHVFEWLTTR